MPIFDVNDFHQGGRQRSKEDQSVVRIICETSQNVVLAFWGTYGANTVNIDLIENAYRNSGFPIRIDCDVNVNPPPQDFLDKYGHSYWIAEKNRVEIA